MTQGQLYVKTYKRLPFNEKEALRYAGVKSGGEELLGSLRLCFAEAVTALTYRTVQTEVSVASCEDGVRFPFGEVHSLDLKRCLDGCETAVVFAATVGLGMDRLVAKYGRLSPSKAILMQGIGAERIEALCDAVSEDIAALYAPRGLTPHPRFSPGYGDLPLSCQRDIIRLLDTPGRIGLSLNESMMMSPSKSVTAIVGLK